MQDGLRGGPLSPGLAAGWQAPHRTPLGPFSLVGGPPTAVDEEPAPDGVLPHRMFSASQTYSPAPSNFTLLELELGVLSG